LRRSDVSKAGHRENQGRRLSQVLASRLHKHLIIDDDGAEILRICRLASEDGAGMGVAPNDTLFLPARTAGAAMVALSS
jgi:hypothetical protein